MADRRTRRQVVSDGIYNYLCRPHQGLGMKGSIIVGDDYPTTG